MKHVLIVEDDRGMALMLEDVLVDAGYDVEHAVDLAQGEDIMANKPIDAAILDIRIGGGASYPLARELHARHIPCLFASSVRRIEMPPDMRWTPLIGKPYTADQLLTSLKALCGEIGADAAPEDARRNGAHPHI
jgi:DNA-binding response OmpR family regulator